MKTKLIKYMHIWQLPWEFKDSFCLDIKSQRNQFWIHLPGNPAQRKAYIDKTLDLRHEIYFFGKN